MGFTYEQYWKTRGSRLWLACLPVANIYN